MSFLVSKRYFLSKNLTSRINSVFDYVDTLPSFMDGLAFDVGGEDMLSARTSDELATTFT